MSIAFGTIKNSERNLEKSASSSERKERSIWLVIVIWGAGLVATVYKGALSKVDYTEASWQSLRDLTTIIVIFLLGQQRSRSLAKVLLVIVGSV